MPLCYFAISLSLYLIYILYVRAHVFVCLDIEMFSSRKPTTLLLLQPSFLLLRTTTTNNNTSTTTITFYYHLSLYTNVYIYIYREFLQCNILLTRIHAIKKQRVVFLRLLSSPHLYLHTVQCLHRTRFDRHAYFLYLTHTQTQTHTHTHKYIYIYTRAHRHIYTHTHMQSLVRFLWERLFSLLLFLSFSFFLSFFLYFNQPAGELFNSTGCCSFHRYAFAPLFDRIQVGMFASCWDQSSSFCPPLNIIFTAFKFIRTLHRLIFSSFAISQS